MDLANHVNNRQPASRWDEQSLREWAHSNLGTTQVAVLANCEPYRHDIRADGMLLVQHSTSGLVTAVEPLIRATSGTWLANGSGVGDHLTVERDNGLDVPPGDSRYRLRRVWLTDAEVQGYYEGFANEGLWPLCHRAHVRPVFRATDFQSYWDINSRFVDELGAEVQARAPIVLIQDYHLALAPQMARACFPLATIGAFWHIPWPTWQVIEMCPWKRELVEGLMGADVLGFQTPVDCQNFLATAEHVLGARILGNALVSYAGHQTEVRCYPTSIEWPSPIVAEAPSVDACRSQLRRQLDLAPDAALTVSIARLDYTKGLEEAFSCIERLLETYPEFRGRLTHVQVAQPSRTKLRAYRELFDRVVAAADRVNRRFGQDSYRPVVVLCDHHAPAEVYRLLRAADVCYVGSLHDGMNLVAKEFVAARDDEQGVLVLSAFTGAAWQLPDALIVNPYDLDQVAETLVLALTMSIDEQREQMKPLRSAVADNNAHKWAASVLGDLARIRLQRQPAPAGSESSDRTAPASDAPLVIPGDEAAER